MTPSSRGSAPELVTRSYLPERPTLASLRAAVQCCRGCDLYQHATQAVFGAGEASARIMLVGEQPGDREDLKGAPFVGPAGAELDTALREVGIPRTDIYVTNALKHFKFKQRGKRRIHEKPTRYELRACRPWLDAELELVRPEVLLLLGATATQALLGPDARVTRLRGHPITTEWAPMTMVTVHPASILRIPDADARSSAHRAFTDDLSRVAAHLRTLDAR